MKRTKILTYTSQFDDLARRCQVFVTSDYNKIDRYIRGMTPEIWEMVTSIKPNAYDSSNKLAFSLTSQVVCQGTLVKKNNTAQAEDNKRKYDGNSKEIQGSPMEESRHQESICYNNYSLKEI